MEDKSRRNFLKQFAVLSAGASTFILTGCPMYGPQTLVVSNRDPQDKLGNLFIRNVSLTQIALFDRENMLKVIGGFSYLYRVKVPINFVDNSELKIFPYWEIEDNIDAPPPEKVIKRWSVNLPSEIIENPDHIWVIDESTTQDCGELRFNYQTETNFIVNVHVYASGVNITTEQVLPGKRINLGLAYGEYTIEYVFLQARAPKAGNRMELGKITTETVNGEEVPITVNLNANTSKIERTVPNWEG